MSKKRLCFSPDVLQSLIWCLVGFMSAHGWMRCLDGGSSRVSRVLLQALIIRLIKPLSASSGSVAGKHLNYSHLNTSFFQYVDSLENILISRSLALSIALFSAVIFRCTFKSYCGREHQIADFKAGHRKCNTQYTYTYTYLSYLISPEDALYDLF